MQSWRDSDSYLSDDSHLSDDSYLSDREENDPMYILKGQVQDMFGIQASAANDFLSHFLGNFTFANTTRRVQVLNALPIDVCIEMYNRLSVACRSIVSMQWIFH
jgi:hypothetical protein